MWLILPAFCAVSINVRCGMATEDPFAPIRNELRGALAAYSTEAAQMRNILLTLEQSPEEQRAAIQARQASLDAARERFERAKAQYVRDVLGDLGQGPFN